jgi:hypothetical protein
MGKWSDRRWTAVRKTPVFAGIFYGLLVLSHALDHL